VKTSKTQTQTALTTDKQTITMYYICISNVLDGHIP